MTAGVLTAVSAFLGSFLSVSDDEAWQRYALSPMRARYAPMVNARTSWLRVHRNRWPSEPVLRKAIAAGYAPNLAAWIASGSHRLVPWTCDLSSQTSAMQAGILLGSNTIFPHSAGMTGPSGG